MASEDFAKQLAAGMAEADRFIAGIRDQPEAAERLDEFFATVAPVLQIYRRAGMTDAQAVAALAGALATFARDLPPP